MKSEVSTRRRLLYALALVASVVGLLLDRTYRTNVSEAAAKADSAGVIPSKPVAGEDLAPIGPPIAAIFESITEPRAGEPGDDRLPDEIRDAFSLSPLMRDYYEARSDRAEQEKAKSAGDERAEAERDITEFKSTHTLQGTFVFPDDRWAVINNQILRIDAQIDGFTLREISHYRVTFVKGGTEVVIALPDTESLQGMGGDTR